MYWGGNRQIFLLIAASRRIICSIRYLTRAGSFNEIRWRGEGLISGSPGSGRRESSLPIQSSTRVFQLTLKTGLKEAVFNIIPTGNIYMHILIQEPKYVPLEGCVSDSLPDLCLLCFFETVSSERRIMWSTAAPDLEKVWRQYLMLFSVKRKRGCTLEEASHDGEKRSLQRVEWGHVILSCWVSWNSSWISFHFCLLHTA